jgi:stringent starvation protein B
VKDGEIVLNISMDATSALKLGNEYIEFKARFAGVARDIMIPLGRVMAIYARENGQGMAFPPEEAESAPVPAPGTSADAQAPSRNELQPHRSEGLLAGSDAGADEPEPPRPGSTNPGRPALKRVK